MGDVGKGFVDDVGSFSEQWFDSDTIIIIIIINIIIKVVNIL